MSVYIIVIAFLAFMIAKLKHMNICKSKHKGVNMANKELWKQGVWNSHRELCPGVFFSVNLAEVRNLSVFRKQTLPGNALPWWMWKPHSQHSSQIQSHLGDFAAGIQIGYRLATRGSGNQMPTNLPDLTASRITYRWILAISPAAGCRHKGRWGGWGPVTMPCFQQACAGGLP